MDDVLAKAAARCEVLFSGGDDAAGVSRQRARGWWASAIMWSFPAACIRCQDEAPGVEELLAPPCRDDVVAMGETGLDYFYA